MSESETVKTGGCYCGKIRYRLEGEPRWTTVCHCVNCKRFSGTLSGYTAQIHPKSGFSITSGEEVMKTAVDSKTQSGDAMTRAFCSECGSNLFVWSRIVSDVVSVAAGTLDEWEDWTPAIEQHCINRIPWLPPSEGTYTYERNPTDMLNNQ